jgi:cytochrome c biogenesis protein CcdA/thiol-disulfide isomerase/thioredoxin
MTILLVFSFLAGFVTILAPCIWPLLPIVLSASSAGGRRRPLGITLGVMTSFTVFTLTISYLEKIFPIDPNALRLVAVIVIGLLGLSMMIPPLATAFENFINRILSPFQNRLQKQGTGFGAGYLTGFSIGMVWAPCAGPILATIATLAATQAVNSKIVLITLAYVSGLGIPLFLFSLAGSRFFARTRAVNKYTGRIQQVFGFVMIVAALLIYTNYDKTIQLKILDAFPSYGNFLNSIEHNEKVTKGLSALRGDKETLAVVQKNAGELPDLGEAPELTGIAHWLNSPPLTMKELRGRVVLVDFWTYSCINCVRTLPHVTGWYEKYKDNGFVVLGIHTPEFAFEKETKNVANALEQFKINFPVAQDNDYATWSAYQNHYWPAKYLVDAKGRIRYTHFGEGKYDETELAIRQLLQEAGQEVRVDANFLKDATPRLRRTPETYLGSGRAERFASSDEKLKDGLQIFSAPADIPQDHFAYQGAWNISAPAGVGQKGSSLLIKFRANEVFLVIGASEGGAALKVFLDGKLVEAQAAGADVKDGRITVQEERLYRVIDLKGRAGTHELRLECQNDGIVVYAFTFG